MRYIRNSASKTSICGTVTARDFECSGERAGDYFLAKRAARKTNDQRDRSAASWTVPDFAPESTRTRNEAARSIYWEADAQRDSCSRYNALKRNTFDGKIVYPLAKAVSGLRKR
jgi:hypothetical protein